MSISILCGFSLLLSAVAGVQKIVIFAGENSPLNFFFVNMQKFSPTLCHLGKNNSFFEDRFWFINQNSPIFISFHMQPFFKRSTDCLVLLWRLSKNFFIVLNKKHNLSLFSCILAYLGKRCRARDSVSFAESDAYA